MFFTCFRPEVRPIACGPACRVRFPNPLAYGVARQSKFGRGEPAKERTNERAVIAISGDGGGGGGGVGSGERLAKTNGSPILNRVIFLGVRWREKRENERDCQMTFGVELQGCLRNRLICESVA